MIVQTKKLLGKEMCTLTCSATGGTHISLSCNGKSNKDDENFLTVPKGSTISYTIPAYSSASSKSGSITMDSNKTLTATYSSSQSYTDVSWSQPTLSSNGTLGGSAFAVKGDTDYNSTNRASFRAFNGNGTSDWWSATTKNNWPINMIMYFPIPVRIASLHIYNSGTSGYNTVTSFTEGTIDYSSDGSSWATAKSFTNTYVGRGGNSGTSAHPEYRGDWYINSITSSSISSYYKQYWRIHATAGYLNSNVNQGLSEVYITAYTRTTTTTYYWNVTY